MGWVLMIVGFLLAGLAQAALVGNLLQAHLLADSQTVVIWFALVGAANALVWGGANRVRPQTLRSR